MVEFSRPLDLADPPSHAGDVRDLWAHVVDELAAPIGGLEAALQRLADRICQVLDAATVIFVTGSDHVLDPLGFADTDAARLAALRKLFSMGRPQVGEGVIGRVAAERRGILIDDSREIPQEDRFGPYRGYAEQWQLNSFLAMPMVVRDDVVGVLCVSRHEDRPRLTDKDAPFVERLAEVVGRAIRVVRLMEHGRMADAALGAISDAVVAVDQDCRLTYWNEGAEDLFGYTSVEVLGRPVTRVIRAADGNGADNPTVEDWAHSLCRSDGWTAELDQLTKSGARISVEIRASALPEHDESSRQGGAVIIISDVGAVREARRTVERHERLAQAALDASPMMSAMADDDGVILVASAAWKSRIGEQWSEGASLWGAVAQILGEGEAQVDFRRRFQRVTDQDRPRSHGDYDVLVDGEHRTFSVHTARVPDVGVSITIADITDRASREKNLSFEATHDLLTRLPNRTVLLDRAEHALNRAARNQDRVGLLFCDLDAFKELNDIHGHDTGDEVLELFAKRLVESCRVTDTVVRLHGDEFAVLIEDSVDADTVQAVADRIVSSLVNPMETAVGLISITASVGVVVFEPDPGQQSGIAEVEALLRHADAAMYAAKRRGKNRWELYDETLRVQAERADAFIGDLLRGAGSGEFVLHMQPQFDSAGVLAGAEALLRWNHPERGLIEPFEVFRHGWSLPMSIGDWVVKQSAEILASWDDLLPERFRLGINLSRAQWLDRNTPGYVMDSLARLSVSPQRVRLEVSQESLSADPDWSAAASQRLSDDGVQVAVNSFGVGTARLADLVRPKIHTVIIGRRLIRESASTERARALVRGCVELAHSMGWQVVATGVETADQLDAVHAAGCDLSQGFLLGRPVTQQVFADRYLLNKPSALPGQIGL